MGALDRIHAPAARGMGENAPQTSKSAPVWLIWLQDFIGGFALFGLIYAALALPYVLGACDAP